MALQLSDPSDAEEEVVDLVTPDKTKEVATRNSSTTSACASPSKPFWNSQKQQMQLVLSSGETVDIGKPSVVNKKAPKSMSKKPASLMKRVSSKRAAGMGEIRDSVVEEIALVNGSGRAKNPSAYLCAKVRDTPDNLSWWRCLSRSTPSSPRPSEPH